MASLRALSYFWPAPALLHLWSCEKMSISQVRTRSKHCEHCQNWCDQEGPNFASTSKPRMTICCTPYIIAISYHHISKSTGVQPQNSQTKEKEKEKQTDRQRQRDRGRETETETQRHTHTETDRQRQTDRQTDRGRNSRSESLALSCSHVQAVTILSIRITWN